LLYRSFICWLMNTWFVYNFDYRHWHLVRDFLLHSFSYVIPGMMLSGSYVRRIFISICQLCPKTSVSWVLRYEHSPTWVMFPDVLFIICFWDSVLTTFLGLASCLLHVRSGITGLCHCAWLLVIFLILSLDLNFSVLIKLNVV
jgi:4-amino-4-deoxy-L-arabinose transferase-like glycosyltransferase